MELSDLFVSYTHTDPVNFQFNKPSLPKQIYANLERARAAAAAEPAPQSSQPQDIGSDMATWTVQGYTPQQPAQQAAQQPGGNPRVASQQAAAGAQQHTSSGDNYSSTVKFGDSSLPQYWMNKFANLGCSPAHQVAIVSSMYGECGLQPRGAVERKELAGKGNTKKGWAHAGEGAVGFTHWSLKRDIIAKYNADPRRKGPKLSTDEAVYSRPDSRHIVDLDDDDHALMAYLFYEDLINRTQNMNFDDTVAEFYLQKAGRGFGGKTGTSYDKAMRAARVYQNSHAKLGYTKAAQVNTFLKQLNFAKKIGNATGYHA